MNEKSFREIQEMTAEERREYYKQREKETNSQPGKKIRATARKNLKRKKNRERNKNIRNQRYDRPFGWNPQSNPKVMSAVQKRRRRRLQGVAPIPVQ